MADEGAVEGFVELQDQIAQVTFEACVGAVKVGKANNMAPFEDRTKVYTRYAKAYQKKGNLGKATEMF
ncbi:hypothetical protein ACHAWF_002976 [Thalassiosira exigua]